MIWNLLLFLDSSALFQFINMLFEFSLAINLCWFSYWIHWLSRSRPHCELEKPPHCHIWMPMRQKIDFLATVCNLMPKFCTVGLHLSWTFFESTTFIENSNKEIIVHLKQFLKVTEGKKSVCKSMIRYTKSVVLHDDWLHFSSALLEGSKIVPNPNFLTKGQWHYTEWGDSNAI